MNTREVAARDRVKILAVSYYNGNRWIRVIETIIDQEATVREVFKHGISVNVVSDGKGYFVNNGDYAKI